MALLSFGSKWKRIFECFIQHWGDLPNRFAHCVIFSQTIPFFFLESHYRPVIMCIHGFLGWKPDDNPFLFKTVWCSIGDCLLKGFFPVPWFVDSDLCGVKPPCHILISKRGHSQPKHELLGRYQDSTGTEGCGWNETHVTVMTVTSSNEDVTDETHLSVSLGQRQQSAPLPALPCPSVASVLSQGSESARLQGWWLDSWVHLVCFSLPCDLVLQPRLPGASSSGVGDVLLVR